MDTYSTLRKDEVVCFAENMDRTEGVMLSASQREKDKHLMISFMVGCRELKQG